MAPKDVHIIIPGTCGCHLTGRRGLLQRGCQGRGHRWARYSVSDLIEGGRQVRVTEGLVMMEAQSQRVM